MIQRGEDNSRSTQPDDVAIVGMACLLPGADTPARFWHNIINKVDCVTDPPPDWQSELFLDPTGKRDDCVYTGRGGYLGDLCRFDPKTYGVMPSGIDGSEPDQFIALRCAYEALADAGVPDVPINCERTGVVMGRGTYLNRGYVSLVHQGFMVDQVVGLLRQIEPDRSDEDLALLKRELKRGIPPLNADTVPGLCHSVLVGRIANRLNLNGPCYTVDGACASSLLALDAGLRELRSGHSDAMLVGGVAVSTPALIDLMFCRLEALSRTGRIAPFSGEANGTLLGQGCGVVVLKRCADAEQDGNRIYAILKSVGVASDGRGGGLLAPQQAGQELAINRAYNDAGLSPHSVDLIEAHGTGIPLGDKTELRSLTECFGMRRGKRPAVALGSVKSMISHLIPAAGIASLIKTTLALYHRVLPPTLHAEEPSPDLELDKTPFYLATEPRPWIHANRNTPRRAGINAFGFGGINAHAIVEEYKIENESQLDSLNREWPVELVIVSADDRAALKARAASLADWVDKAEGASLASIAQACAGDILPSALSICATSRSDLSKKLRQAEKMLAEPGRTKIQARSGMFWYEEPLAGRGQVAFVFPGEGAQYVDMLKDLCFSFPEVRRQFDLTDEAFAGEHPSDRPSRFIFPTAEDAVAAEAALFKMDVAVEAVMTANRAFMALLQSLHIKPDAVVGHSSGEFAALLAAGAVEITDDNALVDAVKQGKKCTTRIINSGLVPKAVLTSVGGAGVEAVEEAVATSEGRLRIALDNCPHQLVLVGAEDATTRAVEQLRRKGAICQTVPWDRAYHTEAFAPACGILEDYCNSLRLKTPAIPLWSCVTGEPYPTEPEAISALMVQQWRSKVRFRETVLSMHRAGIRVFVEVGPRGNLASFIGDTLSDVPHAAVALDVQHKSGLQQLCFALGMLAAHGVPMRLDALYARRGLKRIDLDAAPPLPEKLAPLLPLALPVLKLDQKTVQALRGDRSGRRPCRPSTEYGARLPAAKLEKATARSINGHSRGRSARTRMLSDYQDSMREFLTTQQNVMTQLMSGRAAKTRAKLPPHDGTAIRAPSASDGTHDAARRLPLVDDDRLRRSEGLLVVEYELDITKQPFLRDHAFGRRLSVNDPELRGLVVMPLAITMEFMAEAAAALKPEWQVVAMREIRLHKWLACIGQPTRIRIEAHSDNAGNIETQIGEIGSTGASTLLASCIVEMSHTRIYPAAARLEVDCTGESRWHGDAVYRDGMFHGPAYQAVASVDARDDRSVRATLRMPSPELLFGDDRGMDLILPVTLIDGAGQVIGLWGGEENHRMGFPSSIERMEFDATIRTGASFTAVSRIEDTRNSWRSDIEVMAENNSMALRMTGRVEQIAEIPPHIWRYRVSPESIVFSHIITGLFDHVPGGKSCTLCELEDVAGPWLVGPEGVWSLLLARYALNTSEREAFDNLKCPQAAKASWLLGRVVAKDAVRLHLSRELCMADVAITPDAMGRPVPRVPGMASPLLSLSHSGLQAIAICGDPTALCGVGIDLEPVRDVDETLRAEAFTSDERILIDDAASHTGQASNVWCLSAWCAKEAIGKALGAGLPGGPRDVEIIEIDADTGRIGAALRGSLLESAPEYSDGTGTARRIDAYRRLHNDHVLALCILIKDSP
ncbi:MAG: beta-ketoacyl synthase N-terminal-like domain-containing protein [Planctomycetota bacterium]